MGGGGNKAIAPEKNGVLVRVRVWVGVDFGAGGQFPSGAIVLESTKYIEAHFYTLYCCFF